MFSLLHPVFVRSRQLRGYDEVEKELWWIVIPVSVTVTNRDVYPVESMRPVSYLWPKLCHDMTEEEYPNRPGEEKNLCYAMIVGLYCLICDELGTLWKCEAHKQKDQDQSQGVKTWWKHFPSVGLLSFSASLVMEADQNKGFAIWSSFSIKQLLPTKQQTMK